ncbi:hypothetical protein [Actinocorallia longicatena]
MPANPESLQHLRRLASAFRVHGLVARVEQPGGTPVLRLAHKNTGRVLYVACVLTAGTWSWLWTGNVTPVSDPKAPALIAEALHH